MAHPPAGESSILSPSTAVTSSGPAGRSTRSSSASWDGSSASTKSVAAAMCSRRITTISCSTSTMSARRGARRFAWLRQRLQGYRFPAWKLGASPDRLAPIWAGTYLAAPIGWGDFRWLAASNAPYSRVFSGRFKARYSSTIRLSAFCVGLARSPNPERIAE